MVSKKNRLTVIVVPQTAKRSFSFTFAPAWLAVITLLSATLSGGVWFYRTQVEALRGDLAELESLRQTTRLQQAEIEQMHDKAMHIQVRLQELEVLEQQIKQMTGKAPSVSSRSTDTREGSAGAAGRGGPQAGLARQENLPTLATLLPTDVKTYVLGRRDTLQLDLKLKAAARDPNKTLETAQVTNAAFEDQILLLADSAKALAQGKEDIADHLHFLAHKPSGWPIHTARITDRFGWRWSPFGWGGQQHSGMDFAATYWTPILATGDGVVTHAGWKSGGFGYAVMIDHGYGYVTLYAHMVDWEAKVGQQVKRGDVIGYVGNTGLSTGPHLHYEVHLWGTPVDPSEYLH